MSVSVATFKVRRILLRRVTSSFSERVYNLVQSVEFFRTMSDYTANTVKVYLAYSPSLEVDWLDEGCVGWYPYNVTTGEISAVPPRSIPGQKQAADESFITRKDGKAPVRFRKALFTNMSKACSAAEAAGVQPDELVSLHPDNVSEGADDRDGGHVEPIWNLQDLTDHSAGCVSAFQQIESLCEKAG